ncbi:MAG TPA: hypothetical protein VFK48_01575 [Usitatibacter sp.]|nr:hypothetical protein [Usitatibacter sp.]
MSHDRDHDHPAPAPAPKPPPVPQESRKCPDRGRSEHPSIVPREPVDPKSHPSRRILAMRARPA